MSSMGVRSEGGKGGSGGACEVICEAKGRGSVVKFAKRSARAERVSIGVGASASVSLQQPERGRTWDDGVEVDEYRRAVEDCAPDQLGSVTACCVRRLTYAAAVKHEVARAAVAEAPRDGARAEGRDGGVEVGEGGRGAGEDGVVRGGRPEARVGLRRGRLPERERVGDPVREEQAWRWCTVVRAGWYTNFPSGDAAE